MLNKLLCMCVCLVSSVAYTMTADEMQNFPYLIQNARVLEHARQQRLASITDFSQKLFLSFFTETDPLCLLESETEMGLSSQVCDHLHNVTLKAFHEIAWEVEKKEHGWRLPMDGINEILQQVLHIFRLYLAKNPGERDVVKMYIAHLFTAEQASKHSNFYCANLLKGLYKGLEQELVPSALFCTIL